MLRCYHIVRHKQKTMAIKKESRGMTADGKKNRNENKDELIQTRTHLKRMDDLKDYEAGIDPQDEQFNTIPEGEGAQRGTSKPGGGNRLR